MIAYTIVCPQTCLAAVTFNSPRLRFSQPQQRAVLSFAKALGAQNVLTLNRIKKCVQALKSEVGDPTQKKTSSHRNVYYLNDIGESLKHVCNVTIVDICWCLISAPMPEKRKPGRPRKEVVMTPHPSASRDSSRPGSSTQPQVALLGPQPAGQVSESLVSGDGGSSHRSAASIGKRKRVVS